MPSDGVALAWCSGAMVDAPFAQALAELFRDDRTRPLIRAHLAYQSGPHLSLARDTQVRRFLATGLPWLLMVDSDIVFTPDDVLRLAASGDPDTAPIVGGSYIGYIPATGHAEPEAQLPDPSQDRGDLQRVGLIGAGFLLIHRRVFLALDDGGTLPWFEELVIDGAAVGEDWGFCHRAGNSGFPIYLNSAVTVGHCKRIPLYPNNPGGAT